MEWYFDKFMWSCTFPFACHSSVAHKLTGASHTHTHTHTQKSLSHVQLFATPWIVAHQAPWSMGFSRHEYWSGLPFPQVKRKVPKRMVGAWQALLQILVNCTPCDFPLHLEGKDEMSFFLGLLQSQLTFSVLFFFVLYHILRL